MGPSQAIITLPSGQTMVIVYQWTFGEMAIAVLLMILIALLAVRFAYSVVYQVWWQRRSVLVRELEVEND